MQITLLILLFPGQPQQPPERSILCVYRIGDYYASEGRQPTTLTIEDSKQRNSRRTNTIRTYNMTNRTGAVGALALDSPGLLP